VDRRGRGRRSAARASPGRPRARAQTPAPEVVSLDIPDLPVLDQEGQARHFYSDLVQGRVVAVNFIFTHCTTICPPLAATFSKLRKLLGDRAGREVNLISISVDPATDTPERLKAWSQRFGAGPGWTLVTGRKEDIVLLLKALGAYTSDITDHPPLVLISNARGQWTRAYGLAPPAKLLTAIDRMTALGAGSREGREGGVP
jgi:protein SCO1/2